MNLQQETNYYEYTNWALDHGCDTSLVEVNEDGDVFVAQDNETGYKMIEVPEEFADIATLTA
jgi:hypothetical protein